MVEKNFEAATTEHSKKFNEALEKERKQKEIEEIEKWKQKMVEYTPYIIKLKGSIYSFTINGFGYSYFDAGYITKVSNVLMIPIKQINVNNANEIKSFIEIIGVTETGEKLEPIIVPLEDIERKSFYINPDWGLKVIFESSANKHHQINSIKILGKDIPQETTYKFTGFTKINNKTVFLHSGGAIGTDEDVKVDLGDEVLNKYKITDKEFDIKEAGKMSLSCLDTAKRNITIPIYALIYFSTLTSTFEELGIPVGFLSCICGEQQSMKTSLSSAFVSHFGNFDKNHTPMNFSDSISSVTEKCSMLSDLTVICDDLHPTANKSEATHFENLLEHLVKLCFDRASGSRSKSNGELRKVKRAKGQVLVTGETIPPQLSQSRKSRILVIEVKKGDINPKNLKKIQENRDQLQYIMKHFLLYRIENEEKIKNKIPNVFSEKVNNASTSENITFRTAEMISSLYVGLDIFTDFAVENNIITKEEKKNLLNESWKILLELGKKQNEMVESVAPIQMIENATKVLTSTGKLVTVDYESAKYMKPMELFKSEVVGFYDSKEKMHLIYPDLLYKAIKKFYSEQGLEFPLDKSGMCKELMQKGYLYKTTKQERPQIRRNNPRTGAEESFIAIPQSKIYIVHRYNNGGIIIEE